jgi:hypothetical protein
MKWIAYFYWVNINITISLATPDDAAAIADVITLAAHDLTTKHGSGHWSAVASEKGVLNGMSKARIPCALLLQGPGLLILLILRLFPAPYILLIWPFGRATNGWALAVL